MIIEPLLMTHSWMTIYEASMGVLETDLLNVAIQDVHPIHRRHLGKTGWIERWLGHLVGCVGQLVMVG